MKYDENEQYSIKVLFLVVVILVLLTGCSIVKESVPTLSLSEQNDVNQTSELKTTEDPIVAAKREHYVNGEIAFSNADYDKAYEEFIAAGDYKDAVKKANEALSAGHYVKAEELASKGKYEEAISEFEKAGDYSDSTDKIFSIYHLQGERALTNEDYDKAIEYYKKANEIKNISEEISEIYYVQGVNAFKAEEYDKAVSFFKEAGTYKDSQEQILAISYKRAELALKNGDNEAAIKYFTEAKDYNNASERIQMIYYNLGSEAVKSKKYDEAIEYFTKTNNFKDSSEQILAIYYLQGTQAFKDGDYGVAVAKFTQAGTYKDASEQILNVFYYQGTQALKKNEYDSAIEFFTKAGDFKDAKNQIIKAYCNKGNYLFSNKEYEEAAKTIKLAGDDKLAIQTLNNAISTLIDKKDYENAVKMISYCNSTDSHNFHKYIDGKRAYDSKDLKTAAVAFEDAGTIKDAKQLAVKCNYSLGLVSLQNYDYESAIKYFQKCGKYGNAQQYISVCHGESALDKEQYKTAIQYYKKVSSKLKVKGINIKARKTLMSRIPAFEKISGEWKVKSNNFTFKRIYVNPYNSKARGTSKWSLPELMPDQKITIEYDYNDNGTINLYINIRYYFYDVLEDVISEYRDDYKELKGLKKVPTTIKIDKSTKLVYKKGLFTFTQSKYRRNYTFRYYYNAKVIYKKAS